MKDILANPKRIAEIKKVHSVIKENYRGLSLEDVLIVGFNWDREKILNVTRDSKLYESIKSFFYNWNYSDADKLSKFRLYNQPAICRHARYRAVFLQDMKSKGYDLGKKLSISQLEEISCHSIDYATVTYAIKCYLLANYSDKEIKAFRGVQPQTGPVNNSMEHLFGCEMSNYKHTTICNDLHTETGISPTDINTAFYTMG